MMSATAPALTGRWRDQLPGRGIDVPKGTCSAEGCDRDGRLTRSLCDRHYAYARRHQLIPPAFRPRGCSVAGCDEPHRARGYCKAHYLALWWTDKRVSESAACECIVCARQFVPHPRTGNRRQRPRFCSVQCRGVALSGANHYHWQGGVPSELALEPRRARSTGRYRAWRVAVLERDGFTCQSCGAQNVDLHADHIKSFARFPDLRFELDNGRALCVPCHVATPTYGGASIR